MPRWARVEKVDLLDAAKVVDDVFSLGVSLRSSDYITEEELRSYGLASIDDDGDDVPSGVPSLGVGVPPSMATSSLPAASSTMPPAVPSGVPPTAAGPPVAPTLGTSTHRKSIPTRTCKALRVRVEDTPGSATAAVDLTDDEPTSFPSASAREGSDQAGSSSGRASGDDREEPMPSEVKLGLIAVGMLSPRCRELVSASVHLAPHRFHEVVRQSSQRKLLERLLVDNIRVSIPFLLVRTFLYVHSDL